MYGVETPGGTVRCDAIALCTGIWSRRVANLANLKVPVWPCEHFYLLTRPIKGVTGHLPSLSDHDGHLYIRDESGGLLVECFEPEARSIDPSRLGEDFAFRLLPEDWDHFEPMMRNALHRVPALETAEVKMLLNGPESFTPDGMFLLGESAGTGGFFLGCGMNSFGVASGGGAGMALAHCIAEGYPPFDLREADPNRFADEFSSVKALSERVPEVLGKHYEIDYPGREPDSARFLKCLPAHEFLVAAGAVFGQMHGWERPLYFGSLTTDGKPRVAKPTFGRPGWFDLVAAEVRAAHQAAALFEQSTLGKIRVEGPDTEFLLDRVCANDLTRPPGHAIYTFMLNTRGGFVEDLIAKRFSKTRYRLYTGAAAKATVMTRLRRYLCDGERVTISDETADYATFGLVGPNAARVASSLGADSLNDLRFFQHGEAEMAGVAVCAIRLSYVGEPGWEITCANDDTATLYGAMIAAGAIPAGAYAQTSMRIEKRFLAIGHDLNADITPVEAGLELTVAWDRKFIGRDALLARRDAGLSGRIVTLVFDDIAAVPIGGETLHLDGEIGGRITSAAFGHRVGAPVAIGYINTATELEGVRIQADIASKMFAAKVLLGPAHA